MRAINLNSPRTYFFIQCVLVTLSPLASLIVSIRFFKSTVSQFFILVFAFYFGYHCGFVYDLMNHYASLSLFEGKSFSQILRTKDVYFLGTDYYHILLKYIFTRFTMSRQLFGAYACVIHVLLLLFFLRQLSEYYNRSLKAYEVACFILVAFVVEFYWYQGFRFWPGALFFAGFYLKYLNTQNHRYLVIGSLCFMIHFSLMTLTALAWAEFFLKRFSYKSRIIIAVASIGMRFMQFDFATWAYKNISFLTSFGNNTYRESIMDSVFQVAIRFREYENIFYQQRQNLLMSFAVIIMLVLRRLNVEIRKEFMLLFGFILSLFTIATFGYMSLTFFDRFYKFTTLMTYVFIFLVMATNQEKLKRNRVLLFMLILLPMSYALLTQFVQMRHWLKPELVFGNFFIDFDGNMFRHLRH